MGHASRTVRPNLSPSQLGLLNPIKSSQYLAAGSVIVVSCPIKIGHTPVETSQPAAVSSNCTFCTIVLLSVFFQANLIQSVRCLLITKFSSRVKLEPEFM